MAKKKGKKGKTAKKSEKSAARSKALLRRRKRRPGTGRSARPPHTNEKSTAIVGLTPAPRWFRESPSRSAGIRSSTGSGPGASSVNNRPWLESPARSPGVCVPCLRACCWATTTPRACISCLIRRAVDRGAGGELAAG